MMLSTLSQNKRPHTLTTNEKRRTVAAAQAIGARIWSNADKIRVYFDLVSLGGLTQFECRQMLSANIFFDVNRGNFYQADYADDFLASKAINNFRDLLAVEYKKTIDCTNLAQLYPYIN